MGNTQQLPQNSQKPQQQASPSSSPQNTSPFTCEICIEPMLQPTQKFQNQNKCTHPFCIDCIIKYIQVKLEDNCATIICPALDCEYPLDPISCRPLLPPQLFDKWCDVLCDSAILGLERCYCPNRECSALVVNECGGKIGRCVCPECKKLFCFECKIGWHAGYRCEESGEMRDVNDVVFGVLVERKKWKRCPRCFHVVELMEGCSIVQCRCGNSFCYQCGKKVNQHWCDCNRATVCCIWAFKICLCLLVFLALSFIYEAPRKFH